MGPRSAGHQVESHGEVILPKITTSILSVLYLRLGHARGELVSSIGNKQREHFVHHTASAELSKNETTGASFKEM